MVPNIYTKRILLYLIAGTKGGINRARILKSLKAEPKNTNRLAQELQLDYKTVQHHIDVLVEHKLIEPSKQDAYGALYFLTPLMEDGYQMFEEIWAKIGSR
jgi:predicted transcriptional regulator